MRLTQLCLLLGFLGIFKFFSGVTRVFWWGGKCKDRGTDAMYVPDGRGGLVSVQV